LLIGCVGLQMLRVGQFFLEFTIVLLFYCLIVASCALCCCISQVRHAPCLLSLSIWRRVSRFCRCCVTPNLVTLLAIGCHCNFWKRNHLIEAYLIIQDRSRIVLLEIQAMLDVPVSDQLVLCVWWSWFILWDGYVIVYLTSYFAGELCNWPKRHFKRAGKSKALTKYFQVSRAITITRIYSRFFCVKPIVRFHVIVVH
jgi:hypothetical protein